MRGRHCRTRWYSRRAEPLQPREPDVSARTRAVLDEHRLAPFARHAVGDLAREDVGDAAGRIRHDETNRVIGIRAGLREREECSDQQDSSSDAAIEPRSALDQFGKASHSDLLVVDECVHGLRSRRVPAQIVQRCDVTRCIIACSASSASSTPCTCSAYTVARQVSRTNQGMASTVRPVTGHRCRTEERVVDRFFGALDDRLEQGRHLFVGTLLRARDGRVFQRRRACLRRRECDDVVARPVRGRRPVLARPIIARAASRRRLRSARGASSVATTRSPNRPRAPGPHAPGVRGLADRAAALDARRTRDGRARRPTGAPSTSKDAPESSPARGRRQVWPPSDAGSQARRRADAALPAEATVPVPAPTLPSATGPSPASARAARTARRSTRRPEVVQHAVVGLADHRVDRPDGRHSGLLEHPLRERIGGTPYAQGRGEQDRRFGLAELVHLGAADELAETIPDVDGRRNAVQEEISTVREYGGDTRAHRRSFDEGRMTDAHAGNIGDRIEATG